MLVNGASYEDDIMPPLSLVFVELKLVHGIKWSLKTSLVIETFFPLKPALEKVKDAGTSWHPHSPDGKDGVDLVQRCPVSLKTPSVLDSPSHNCGSIRNGL